MKNTKVIFSAMAAGVMALTAFGVEFANPLFHMDFSDPDLCVGGDGRVYMTASTFGGLPGLPILASSDMVNWDYAGYALEKHPYPEAVGSPEHGKSVYAPSIRYRETTKEYVIYWGDPDHGIYRVAAKNPAGPWSEPRCIVEGPGMIDVCPLYDDDGRVYIVNGWAGSRVGINNQLTIRELDAEETRAISDPTVVFDGGKANHIVCEGPKFYKKDGEYWLWFPAGGVGPGYQVAARAKSIWGPYEDKVVLKRGDTQVNGPHQGGAVQLGGNWWFVHFSDRGAYGRISYLEPVKWPKGDWPVVGENGQPAASFDVPMAKVQKPFGGLPTSDEFDSPMRGRQWFFLGRSAEQHAWATAYGVFRMFTTYHSGRQRAITRQQDNARGADIGAEICLQESQDIPPPAGVNARGGYGRNPEQTYAQHAGTQQGTRQDGYSERRLYPIRLPEGAERSRTGFLDTDEQYYGQ